MSLNSSPNPQPAHAHGSFFLLLAVLDDGSDVVVLCVALWFRCCCSVCGLVVPILLFCVWPCGSDVVVLYVALWFRCCCSVCDLVFPMFLFFV